MRKNNLAFANNVGAPGSSLYYSLLKVDEEKRNAIITLHAFHFEICKISELYKEKSIAETKLAWWQDEITRLYKNIPTHPITQTLQKYLVKFAIPEAALLAIIAAANLSIKTEIYTSQDELAHHYQHLGGLLELLKVRVLANGVADLNTEQYAQTMGIALETIRHMLDFKEHLNRGHLYLPINAFHEAKLSIEEALEKRHLAKLTPLFKQQADFAKTQYQSAQAFLSRAQFTIQRPNRIYAILQMKLLEAIEKDQFQVYQHQIQLSPLKKLWILYQVS